MKRDLIDTIMEKKFHELTDVEREELKSYCADEDEYNQMKEVFVGMESMSWEHPQPAIETKQRLDDLFDSTYPKVAPVWYNSVLTVVVPKGKPIHRQPLAQIAAIALIALLLIPFWNSNSEVVQPKPADQQMAQVEEKERGAESQEVQAEPVIEEAENESILEEVPVDIVSEPTVLVASAATVSTDPALVASAPNSNHPDGVFIAVSQPANETPEMFDLLTATF